MAITFQTSEQQLVAGLLPGVMARIAAGLRAEIIKALDPAIDAAVQDVMRELQLNLIANQDSRSGHTIVLLRIDGVQRAIDQATKGPL